MCLDDANFICRYRNALCSRPKNQLDFPSGQLLTTNTRSSGLSISKYAKDYFILYIFLHGEKSCIKDIFGKNKNDPIFTEINKVTEAELKTTIQSIIERIVDLEKNTVNSKNTTNSFQTSDLQSPQSQFEHIRYHHERLHAVAQ